MDAVLGERIRAALAPLGPERVILFGSYARGAEDRHSDIDLIVVMRTNLPFAERALPVLRCLAGIGRTVEPIVYTPEEFEEMRARDVGLVAKALEEGIEIR